MKGKRSSPKITKDSVQSNNSLDKQHRDAKLVRKLRIMLIAFVIILLGLMLGMSIIQIALLS